MKAQKREELLRTLQARETGRYTYCDCFAESPSGSLPSSTRQA